jgi:hypothetical protein
MTYAYSFTDHFIISFSSFVFLPHSHPETEPITNTEFKKCVCTITPIFRAIGRLARYTTKYMQIDLIRLPSHASICLVLM